MKAITKKRTKAVLIDAVISGVVTAGVEYVLRKKVKNEVVHNVITPTAVLWALEYAQLSRSGQTIGYKTAGLVLENEDGTAPTNCQLMKRMAYRDIVSPFEYLTNRKTFEGEDGKVLPHDRVAGTVVKEV